MARQKDERPTWSRPYMEKRILKLLRNHGDRAFRAKEITKRLDIIERADFLQARDLLEELADSGKVARLKGNRFGFRPPANIRAGTVRVHPDGFGFVTDDDGEEYFVKGRRMGTALDGDRVEIGLGAPARDGRKREAEVIQVLERGRKTAVGTFHRHGHFGVVAPDDKRMTRDIYVAREDWGGANEGDKVLVTIDRFENPKSVPEGRIVNVIGSANDAATRVLALAMSVGIDADFSEQALEEARAARLEITDADLREREDFRGENVFTIDPVDAKDFDDALHIRELQGGRVEVGVHIADVGHFVPEGSALDKDAYARGTSTYLVDRVIPMLPERLSGNLCSLRPNEDRLTYSCVFELDETAQILDYRITPSVIHSKARLTYEQAQAVITGEDSEAPSPVKDAILRLWALAEHLIRERFKDGSIDFDLPEVRVVLDEAGTVTDIVRKDRLPAHRLIEEFMLLANKTVARHVSKQRPRREFVYRTHDHPDKEKIQQLVGYVRGFGYQVRSEDGTIEPAELNRLIREARGKPEEPVIQTAALRAMAKARYSPDDSGHYGLGFRHYSHFTSPIRRYPDLIAHRELRKMRAGRPGPDYGALKAQCDHLSERERVADEAQRESVKLKQVEYMQQHLGDRFTGVISGVTRFGIFVELDAILVEGLVHVRDLADDYYEYDEPAFMLVGRTSGRRFKLGDPVTVTVAAANTETREIDFVLV
ncbi:MAG: ribonuclease R [Rhodothermales bacterium]|nr:ribonuclease R [Rhodothermales bacterium]MBO6780925.1 ribonuclease R [Rhodothermales bacterium]